MRMVPPLKPNYDVYAIGNLGGFENVPSRGAMRNWKFDDVGSYDSQEAIERSPGGYAFEASVMPRPVDYEPTLGNVDMEMMGDMSGREDLFTKIGSVASGLSNYNPFSPKFLPYKAAVQQVPGNMGGFFDDALSTAALAISPVGFLAGEAIKQGTSTSDVDSGSGMFGKPSTPGVGVPFPSKPQVIVSTSKTPAPSAVVQASAPAAFELPASPNVVVSSVTNVLEGDLFGVSKKILLGVAALAAGGLYLAKRKKGGRGKRRR